MLLQVIVIILSSESKVTQFEGREDCSSVPKVDELTETTVAAALTGLPNIRKMTRTITYVVTAIYH